MIRADPNKDDGWQPREGQQRSFHGSQNFNIDILSVSEIQISLRNTLFSRLSKLNAAGFCKDNTKIVH